MPWSNPATRSSGYSVTAANWNELANDLAFLAEVSYAEITSDAAITATTVAGANQIVSAGAITYEAVPHLLQFSCPQVGSAAVTNFLIFRDGTTVLGTLARFAASAGGVPLHREHRFTPTAASHTYNVASYNGAAGTWTYNAGSGGSAGDATTDFPTWMRITRIPT